MSPRHRWVSLSPVFLSVAAATSLLTSGRVEAQVKPHAGMMRYPDVSATHIVFGYANDLWIVPREGGMATPLASPPGGEGFPRFSADGKTIAFVGNYDGGRDIYTIAVDGSDSGLPHRVTHHPSGERLCDWTSDDGLIFSAGEVLSLGQGSKLYTVPVEGGMPTLLPLPYGTSATMSDDGTWIAYTPHTTDNRTWKRYRGGMQTDIWLFNLKDKTSRRMTDWEGTDTLPMFRGKKVYYLSDSGPEHRLNIWEFDIDRNARKQVTEFKDFDVKWPSIGPGKNNKGEIVFQCGADLYLLDLSNNKLKKVEVTIPGDRPTLRERTIDATRFASNWSISPSGKRAVVEARGDIWTAPAENGSPRQLTATSDVAERMPSWSPDGQWISYLSDATGEYELYITQSDGQGETKQLTKDGSCYRYNRGWSPDSKRIVFGDKTGSLFLYTIDGGETKLIDTDPWGQQANFSWSNDSRFIAYDRAFDRGRRAIWIYNVETGDKQQVTSGFFNDDTPTFDRKGDYLYYASNRNFQPQYGDIPGDTTFIYEGSSVLLAVPLRNDIENPWLPKSDEEKWGDKKKEAETKPDASKNGAEGDAKPQAAKDDAISGVWEGTAATPDGELPFKLTLTLAADNSVTGDLSSMMFNFSLTGTWDAASKTLTLNGQVPEGPAITMTLKIDGESMSGSGKAQDDVEVPINATRKSKGAGAAKPLAAEGKEGDKKEEKPAEKKVEPIKIDFDGFERRAMPLPIAAGQFGGMAVNDANVLIYARIRSGNGPESGLYAFDMKDEKKEEKSVASGATNFDISADGKKLLIIRGNAASIQNASAGGGSGSKNVVTTGMESRVDPREEWNQMFNEAWRLYRDFFYVDNMHGVDWPAVKKQYAAMLPDCVVREDLSYIISEMISELNVGHAYYREGDVDGGGPTENVGLLGCDFEIADGAYRISKIYEGAAWDSDARGPLSQPGVNVKEGDYLLAVNGKAMDLDSDPWAPFVGKAGEVVELTVSSKPTIDDSARRVLVKPVNSDGNLRYRAWIEKNRKYVDEKSGGKVGYIYVPNTGRNGQNDLFRMFYGQMGKPALIIDERWNGGGQIPTRFIELLNRPVTNYWAVRDGHDWTWPPDSHQGAKCMLINGLAGSGGDMFPWLFKQAGLGPLIGTRTWGGLVGISGNPGLVDGAGVTVPTFGFYEKDGTWGIEGHGTDPDIEVIDDPALMTNGGDPQLDRAIEEMLKSIAANPYTAAKRPTNPERAGMGVKPEDK